MRDRSGVLGRRALGSLLVSTVLMVALGALAPMVQPTAAQGMQTYYLPWVPSGEMLNGQGPWHGKLSFQNLSDDSCAMLIYVGRPGSWTQTAQLSLTPGATRSVSASSLAVPSPGAPVRLEAFCPIVASLKMVTPDANQIPWSDGANVVTGYTGVSATDLQVATQTESSGWFLPIVQTNSDWNSLIRVASLSEDQPVDVEINLYPSENDQGPSGLALTVEETLGVGETLTLDVLEELGTTGWVGYAQVRATGPVGVLAYRLKPGAAMALTNLAAPADIGNASSRFVLNAPLLFSAYNSWNTGINIANVSNDWADVTVRYFETGNGQVREEQLTLLPRSMRYLYTPGTVEQDGFVGSAVIESDAPVVAAIDEVKYQSLDGLSYMASAVGQQDAAIPVTFRHDPDNGMHDNSGVNLHNLNPDEAQDVEISLVSNTGQPILPEPITVTLPAGGSNFVYLPDVESVPSGTVAAAHIRSDDQAGFVALSNDVNYAVPGDGSVVFAAAGEAGYYRLLGAPAP